MTPDIRHLAPLMAALVIGGAVGAAPAMASTPVAPRQTPTAPAPAPAADGSDRLVAGLVSDGQADLLELLEVAVAGLGHRPAQAADEVQRAERVVRRSGEYLLQRRPLAYRDLE